MIDEVFGLVVYIFDLNKLVGKLNVVYYYCWFWVEEKGVMGLLVRYCGFVDENLFMVMII